MRRIVIVAVIGLLLAGFNWSVAQQESLRANGREVLITLAPVDPRALLMGDYMALNFALNRDVDRALTEKYGKLDRRGQRWKEGTGVSETTIRPSQGLAVVRLTGASEGTEQSRTSGESDAATPAGTLVFVRLDDGSPLAEGEYPLLYRVQGQRAQVAAPAFYFQEGLAKDYENARYGVLRLGKDGRHLLMNLADDQGKPIEPSTKAKGSSPS